MFSFHKPKIYRSSLGCCICKAKSSSSRFTDSKKYEAEFERCFRIDEKRSGEICNACVLLVKRWKKLSPENRLSKHWHHVVDARAGPGTKLNTNRRLINNNNTSNNHGSTSGSGSSAKDAHRGSKSSHGSASEHAYGKSDVLPLSLSQSGNHQASGTASTSHASTSSSSNHNNSNASTSHSHNNNNNNSNCNHGNNHNHLTAPSKRTSSFSKALAIDTNVSTFTFGEPRRKTYGESYNPYATTHLYPASSYASINSNNNYNNNYNNGGANGYNYYSNSKPQSALSSSAFESVMKRFRQRQQQQQLQAQKRQQHKLNQQQQQNQASQKSSSSQKQRQEHKESNKIASKEGEENDVGVSGNSKRPHRCSESSLVTTPDAFRISSILDGSIWKKERTCCGTILRGLNREVAIFPKLFKPCEHRLRLLAKQAGHDQLASESETFREDGDDEVEPSPRTIKSGSISSCDSNTSGTGSMEQANFEPAIQQVASRNSRQTVANVSARRTQNSKKNNNSATVATVKLHQRPKPNDIPTIATRSQRGRSSAAKTEISQTIIQQQEQQSDEQQSPSDDLASTTSGSSNISALSNSIRMHLERDRADDNEDDDTGDDAEIVEEMEEDEDEEDDQVDEEDFDEELEGSEMAGQVDASSELGAGSSSLIVDEEDSTDASCSVDSLVVGGGQNATVG